MKCIQRRMPLVWERIFHWTISSGAGCQQVSVRATRAVPPAVRARRSSDRQSGAMGDRGVQATATLLERGAIQAYLRHVNRFQKHRQQDRERAQAVTVGHWRSSRPRQSITTS